VTTEVERRVVALVTRLVVRGFVVEVAVRTLVDVERWVVSDVVSFKAVVMVGFLVDVTVTRMMVKTSDTTVTFMASIMIKETPVVCTLSGDHVNFPVLAVPITTSSMTTVRSVAPAGTTWMSRGPVSPVVSHIISCGVPTAHESPAIGLCIAACATAEKPTRKKERIDRILYIGVLTDGCNII
jgi:hypothetical protein